MATSKRVRVGKFSVKPFAAEKPVSLGAGGKFISLAEAAQKPATLGPSLASLDDEDQVRLAYERNRLEPDFTLGVIGHGAVKKRELLDHIKQRTRLGKMAIQAELNYVEELVGGLTRAPRARWPKTPTVKAPPVPKQFAWMPRRWWGLLRTCALFCENTTDSVTKLAAAYRKKYVHPVFRARGFHVVVLEGVHDVAAEFVPKAESSRVVYISGVGHGNPTTYTGHLNSPLLEACQYSRSLAWKKSFHLLSCQTAKQLGPDTVKKGAKSYAGYYENFTFVFDDPSTPVDELNLFWRADSTYDIAMALGKTSKVATDQTLAAYNSAIAQVPGTAAATWLTWDRNCLRTPSISPEYGDSKAKIAPFTLTPFLEAEEALTALGV